AGEPERRSVSRKPSSEPASGTVTAPRQAQQRCIGGGERLPRQRGRDPQRLIEFIRLHLVAGVSGGQHETKIAVGCVESREQPDGGEGPGGENWRVRNWP